jgi:hypothetical protein
LSLVTFAITGGSGGGNDTLRLIFIVGFLPLIAFGFMQLELLKKAVESGSTEPSTSYEESEVNNDS